jgi:hypothetical protein
LREPDEALEAVWQRIRRPIASEEWEKFEEEVREKFAKEQVRGINAWTPIVVDLSDLSKPYAEKMEYLATVRDADESSLRGGLILNPGYWLFESYVALGEEGDPLPIACFPFSVEDPRIGSQNRAVDQGLERLRRVLDGAGIVILDRGFDSDTVFGLLEEKRLRFLCRLVGNRTLLDSDGTSLGLAHTVTDRMLLTHEADFRFWKKHRWEGGRLSFGWRTVRLPDTHESYSLLVVRWPGQEEGGLMLLTNVPISSVTDAIKLIRRYFLRWRAEDAIRMLKRELGIETVRVFDFASICRLVEFSFWILALMTRISVALNDDQKAWITRFVGAWPTPVLLFHYRLWALLRMILDRHSPGFLAPVLPKCREVQ